MLSAITEKTGWSTSLLITITGMAVAIALAFGNASERLVVLERRQDSTDERTAKSDEQRTKLELRTQRNEDNYAHILETMGEIRSDVKTLKARVR